MQIRPADSILDHTMAPLAMEESLHSVQQQLDAALVELEHNAQMNEMAHSLHTAMSAEELYEIVGRFALRLFPEYSGALYVIDASRNAVEASATWGGAFAGEP